jgi:hypothetical protein
VFRRHAHDQLPNLRDETIANPDTLFAWHRHLIAPKVRRPSTPRARTATDHERLHYAA